MAKGKWTESLNYKTTGLQRHVESQEDHPPPGSWQFIGNVRSPECGRAKIEKFEGTGRRATLPLLHSMLRRATRHCPGLMTKERRMRVEKEPHRRSDGPVRTLWETHLTQAVGATPFHELLRALPE